MNFTNRYELTEKAMKALKKIKENHNKEEAKNKLLNEVQIPLLTTNKNLMSEEYTDTAFIKKDIMDKNIYNKLTAKLNDDQLKVANSIIEGIQQNVKEIYQLANIKPRTYGFVELGVDSSKEDLVQESNRVINEFLDKNYYKLTSRERDKKYKELVVPMAHELISENSELDMKNALEFSYKSVLVKNLLKKVSLPYFADVKIKELLESDLYQEFFDAERLHILLQEFDGKISDLSKVISISI